MGRLYPVRSDVVFEGQRAKISSKLYDDDSPNPSYAVADDPGDSERSAGGDIGFKSGRNGTFGWKAGAQMDFTSAYKRLLAESRKTGSPERIRLLKRGLGFAEVAFLKKVWWPIHGHFQHLHPEYEVIDYSGGTRYIDFAYLRGTIKLAIEVDGFSTHAQNLDRAKFAYRLHRQNLLTVNHWDILRFSFDDIDSHPHRCQRTIQQYIGSRFAANLYNSAETPRASAVEREIVRLARSLPGPIAPKHIGEHLDLERTTVYSYLRKMVAKGWLVPASGTKRIRTYALTESARRLGV